MFTTMRKLPLPVVVFLLLLVLASCQPSQSVKSTYDIERKDSQLISFLLNKSDFNPEDSFSLYGGVHEEVFQPNEENNGLKENADHLVSGDYIFQGQKLFVTIRHDLFLYQKNPTGHFPSMLS